MLEKLCINSTDTLTAIGWETLFAKIANDIDNLPICKGNSSNLADFGFEIITPNRLKLGRNNQRSLDDSFMLNAGTEVEILESFRKYQQLWYQLMLDRLHHFIPRPKKWPKTDKVEVNSVVVFVHKYSTLQRNWSWSLGRIVEVTDRKVRIEYFGPGKKRKLIATRSPRQVSVICGCHDLPVNTAD